MGILVSLLWIIPGPALEYVQYDIQIFRGTKNTVLNLALNRLDDSRFSIHCRKPAAGSWFTYWATDRENVLLFPRADVAFVGPAGQRFRLFPGGPELAREQWLALLLDRPFEELDGFFFQKDDDWRMITASDRSLIVRWRERKRAFKESYKAKVLEPDLKPGTETRSLSRFSEYWDGLDEDEMPREN